MRKSILLTLIAFVAASPALHAQQPGATVSGVKATAPGKAVIANAVDITATVEAIDKANRTVSLKGPQGRIVTVAVGSEVKNFDQIKVGDSVAARYTQALALELKKGGTGVTGSAEQSGAVRAKAGERPAGVAARETKILANVVAVDAKTQVVTLRGPKGNEVDLRVEDPAQIKNVKPGDQVEATYVEALAIAVEPAAKAGAKK